MENLVTFSSYVGPIDLSFNQYLLTAKEPLLVHTGNVVQAAELAPRLKEALDGRPLAYIFVSHFEADECGGLALLLDRFPGARPICSQVTARQLSGFGIPGDVVVKTPGEALDGDGFRLEFISYPSEAHLWEGLLAFESQRGILFSSDLFIRRGRIEEAKVSADWASEVAGITEDQVPPRAAREALQGILGNLAVQSVALGHGPVLAIR
jgi:flavorubredoxin